MNRDLKRFWQLSSSEKAVFCAALLALPVVATCVRWFGLRVTRRIFSIPDSRFPDVGKADPSAARKLAGLIDAAGRRTFREPNCLTRSLTLCWLMRRAGLPGRLRIGVDRTAGAALAAHAWVECGGLVVNDRADVAASFKPLAPSA